MLKTNSVLVGILIVTIILSGCVSDESVPGVNKDKVSVTPQSNNDVEIIKCSHSGVASTMSFSDSVKGESEAIAFCDKQCKTFGEEYYGHIGTQTPQGYLIVQCSCWCE